MPTKDLMQRQYILRKIARLLRDTPRNEALIELRDWIKAWRPRAASPGGLGK